MELVTRHWDTNCGEKGDPGRVKFGWNFVVLFFFFEDSACSRLANGYWSIGIGIGREYFLL